MAKLKSKSFFLLLSLVLVTTDNVVAKAYKPSLSAVPRPPRVAGNKHTNMFYQLYLELLPSMRTGSSDSHMKPIAKTNKDMGGILSAYTHMLDIKALMANINKHYDTTAHQPTPTSCIRDASDNKTDRVLHDISTDSIPMVSTVTLEEACSITHKSLSVP